MADEIDKAQDLNEFYLRAALRKQQQRALVTPEGTGFCLYCAEPVALDRRWCNAFCRDGWEKEQRG